MTRYRHQLPQSSGELYLTDAGLETDLIFNHGIEIREFAAHTLLENSWGRHAMARYFRGFLSLARSRATGFVLDSPTWKAHPHWASALDATNDELREANREAVNFIADLRDEFSGNQGPIVLNGVIGPRGDAYAPEAALSGREAEAYHSDQIGWLATTDVDMVTALTFTQAAEAVGFVNAARRAGLPSVVSFTVETDGRLPDGHRLGDAILEVDAATGGAAAYFMVNCAHPEHFRDALDDADWLRRIKGLRCNASRRSHAELDEAEELDAGDSRELAGLYRALLHKMPWVNVLGGCCGTDLCHLTEIVAAVAGDPQTATGG